MSQIDNAMAVFKLLNKSNCRDCGRPTCLAFAAAVFKGEAALGVCPHIDPLVAARYGEAGTPGQHAAAQMADRTAQLKARLEEVDLETAAERLQGGYARGKLTLKILGKDFSVDAQGRFSSDIHVHDWVTAPVMDYLLHCQGGAAADRWVAFRELENAQPWENFFVHRCEKPLKLVADTYPDLFEDMVQLFDGRPVENHYQSDVSIVLHPLPRLPLLICYWKPEEGMASSLNLFFDAHAEQVLPIGTIYTLGAGLAQMFEKISLRHGVR